MVSHRSTEIDTVFSDEKAWMISAISANEVVNDADPGLRLSIVSLMKKDSGMSKGFPSVESGNECIAFVSQFRVGYPVDTGPLMRIPFNLKDDPRHIGYGLILCRFRGELVKHIDIPAVILIDPEGCGRFTRVPVERELEFTCPVIPWRFPVDRNDVPDTIGRIPHAV